MHSPETIRPGGHHHSCHYEDDDDWAQFISYSEDIEFQEASPPANPQAEPKSEPLTPIDTAIFEVYISLTVEQIGVQAYKEHISGMYDH